jgi:competence ComEA-like helix-hairpin-helix protein
MSEEWERVPEGQEPEVAGVGASTRVDLNTATVEELQRLPGIGEVLATRIVNHRAEVGPFAHPEDMIAVTGIAEATYGRLADRLSAGPVEPAPAPAPETVLLEPEAADEPPLFAGGPEVEEAAGQAGPAPEPVGIEVEEPEGIPVLMSELLAAADEPAEAPASGPEPERAVKAPPRGSEPPLVEVVKARVGCGQLILTGLLGALLGAALALALMWLINGTLDFQAAALRTAQDEVLRMEGVVGALNVKVAELEERLGAIRELDARLADTQADLRRLSADLDRLKGQVESLAETHGALRQEFTNLREDLDGLAGHVSLLDNRLGETEAQIAALSRGIEVLGESIRRFDAFLAGLQALLMESQDLLEPTPTLQIAPTDTPTPSRTPMPRPEVTVIPLATRTPRP